MQRISPRPVASMLIFIFALIFPAALAAQSFWLERSQGKTFLLEIFKSDVRSGVYNGVSYPVDYSFETSALFFSLRWPIGSKYFLVAELPFAHAAFDTKIDRPFSFYRYSGSSSTIGNPYIGLERGSLNSRFSTEIGLRLPLAKTDNNYAAEIGQAADPDRLEAFENYAALRAMINYRTKRTKGLMFHARVGSIVQRDFDYLRDQYFSLFINPHIGYKTARINIGLNIVIRGGFRKQYRNRLATVFTRGSDFNFTTNQYQGLTASIRLGKLRPGVYFNPSFDRRLIDFFALNLRLQLK